MTNRKDQLEMLRRTHAESKGEETTTVHKFTPIWLAPSENPLDFEHFKKNFQDFSHEFSSMNTSSSEYRTSRASSASSYKKSVSYADTRSYVPLGFRVL